ncbi:hypothetical protein ILT44_26335 [Microvirga sp. BT689]|uniref:hypothetical protein n=1 Tax=Microvirga arvi TaxID=2778731 RepID=UPI00195121CE|nr:hypothetical protein [Microvirga arvi]MBM6583724.1 hypothetical protein [Microvirga arvi]
MVQNEGLCFHDPLALQFLQGLGIGTPRHKGGQQFRRNPYVTGQRVSLILVQSVEFVRLRPIRLPLQLARRFGISSVQEFGEQV